MYRLYIVICILYVGCTDNLDYNSSTKILGHRANGDKRMHTNADYVENSIEAIQSGLQNFDGIEIDIQASSDGTLWIFHDSFLPIENQLCIPSITSKQIDSVNILLEESNKIQRLRDVMPVLKKSDDKIVSLDIKIWFDTLCVPGIYKKNRYYMNIADSIVTLINTFQTKNIMIEAPHEKMLVRIKKLNPDINCFYLNFDSFDNSFETIKKERLDGISINQFAKGLNSKNITELHEAGKMIQVWTVNDSLHFKELIRMQVDFIQTDVVSFMKYVE